ncbi:Carbon monoxide dehydrogenase subunit G [Amycolatopsis xylanica]|uniref:Carbon monoxide dehydrogenase subunit G n=1 Tax=Amycolatopsis xylanica TaxID=589385 RepID=A0A1H3QYG4_9PSEU|nr:SRPBCC family protein [Amycolatopsis xylanica]SDZ18467.1 Carbon monoxide dehydrogenase subunit G [Amycolatopsis xylanica]
MRLDHEFTVPAGIEDVWKAVIDPEYVAPCMPGATVTKVEGDTFSGTVKVKLGPISLLYKGAGEFLEKDAAAKKVVIKASGKDARGAGTASATVTLTLTERDGGTHGAVATELSVTGKPAQFGRGLISEVGGKILDQFAVKLAEKLGTPEAEEEPEPERPQLRSVPPIPETEAIDLVELAGDSMAKRARPLLAAAAALVAFLLIRKLLRR